MNKEFNLHLIEEEKKLREKWNQTKKLGEYTYIDESTGLVVISSYRPTTDCFIRVCLTEHSYSMLKAACNNLNRPVQLGTYAKFHGFGFDVTPDEGISTDNIIAYVDKYDFIAECHKVGDMSKQKQTYIATYRRDMKEVGEYGIDEETLLVGVFDFVGSAELALTSNGYYQKGDARLYSNITIALPNHPYNEADAPILAVAYYLE